MPTPIDKPTITPTPTCVPEHLKPVDAVLVLDRSSSMAGQWLANAQNAATLFVGHMDLARDQVGLVTFAQAAQLAQFLTKDQSAIVAEISRISAASGSNIAAGIDAAHIELRSIRHNPDAIPVMIVLSDGRANTGQSPKDAADAAKADGIHIITIGLSDKVDQELLRVVATSAADYYDAPSPPVLEGIYTTIVGVLHRCDDLSTPLPVTPTSGALPEPPTDTPVDPDRTLAFKRASINS